MKMQILTMGAAILMAAPMLHAQTTTNPAPAHSPMATGRHRAPRGDMMVKELGLTADQQARMKAIRAKYAPQMKAARDAARPDFEAMRSARMKGDTAAMTLASNKLSSAMAPTKKAMDAQRAEMRSVLTPAQQQKMDADRARMTANRSKMKAWAEQHGHTGGMGGGWIMGGRHPVPPQPAS